MPVLAHRDAAWLRELPERTASAFWRWWWSVAPLFFHVLWRRLQSEAPLFLSFKKLCCVGLWRLWLSLASALAATVCNSSLFPFIRFGG